MRITTRTNKINVKKLIKIIIIFCFDSDCILTVIREKIIIGCLIIYYIVRLRYYSAALGCFPNTQKKKFLKYNNIGYYIAVLSVKRTSQDHSGLEIQHL
jgi:hypothetical protein